jgi:hypothetical protein
VWLDAILGLVTVGLVPIVDVRVFVGGTALFNGLLIDGRGAHFVVGGGPIDVRPLVLNRDLLLESDVRAVVAGVPVRGVEAFELAEETGAFVGDFVGDYQYIS